MNPDHCAECESTGVNCPQHRPAVDSEGNTVEPGDQVSVPGSTLAWYVREVVPSPVPHAAGPSLRLQRLDASDEMRPINPGRTTLIVKNTALPVWLQYGQLDWAKLLDALQEVSEYAGRCPAQLRAAALHRRDQVRALVDGRTRAVLRYDWHGSDDIQALLDGDPDRPYGGNPR